MSAKFWQTMGGAVSDRSKVQLVKAGPVRKLAWLVFVEVPIGFAIVALSATVAVCSELSAMAGRK